MSRHQPRNAATVKRPAKAHHDHSHLVVWDEHSDDLSVVSSYAVAGSLDDARSMFSQAFDRQNATMPGDDISFLPMPRVFCIYGAVRELSELGYDYIAPLAQTGGTEDASPT
jgi:hypothetical protein